MVMSLKTKRFEMAENEEIGKESKKRVRKMSNQDSDKSILKNQPAQIPSRNTLKPSSSVLSLKKAKQDEQVKLLSRPQSPSVNKLIKSKQQNKSLSSLKEVDFAEDQQTSQKVVSFNITATMTYKFEGTSIPNSILIEPQVQLGPANIVD